MKSLIIPVITPVLPAEKDLATALHTGKIIMHGAEGTLWEEVATNGVSQDFHDSCERLLSTFADWASGILVGGTTGEGIGLGPLQYGALLSAMQRACPSNISMYAGVLGGDNMVSDQIRSAQSLGIGNIVLGLNHTGNNTVRFQAALEALDTTSKLFLYNLPTFRPADKDFILSCLEDPRVAGFKDSSGNEDFFSWLLSLKEAQKYFQVFHGSEPAYGELSVEEFERVDGLVSGNANVHPALLQAYTNNPRHKVHIYARNELHEQISRLSGRPKGSKEETIETHIHGLKRRLTRLCVSPLNPKVTILSPGQDALHSYKPGSLFQTYKG